MPLHIGAVHADIDVSDPPAVQRSTAGAHTPTAPPPRVASGADTAAPADVERLRPLVLSIIREELDRAVRQRS